jgi:hypothetical protein
MEHKLKEIPEPLLLDKAAVKDILMDSGVDEEKLIEYEKNYEKLAGENTSLLAANIVSTRSFEVKTPDVVIKVNPERSELVQTKIIEGKTCIVIEVNEQVEVNGITVKAAV